MPFDICGVQLAAAAAVLTAKPQTRQWNSGISCVGVVVRRRCCVQQLQQPSLDGHCEEEFQRTSSLQACLSRSAALWPGTLKTQC